MKRINLVLIIILSVFSLVLPAVARAMPIGTILYRTSSNGRMYGYSTDELMKIENKIMKGIYPGHTAIYIGQEDGVDYVVEALADGVVKTPAKYFINLNRGEEFLGAKLPKGLNSIQQIKAVLIAKNLAESDLEYDFDFKKQKGPDSGEWTCVGVVEKIYESANISNPSNLKSLEYDSRYYAIDITPDGFDDESVFNEESDCFSEDYEFSKIAKRNTIAPAPEIFGYNAGLEYRGDRYIFFPYTQFLQDSLEDVEVDIEIASHFIEEDVRGSAPKLGLILKWSLVNNPISSIKNIARNIQESIGSIKQSFLANNKDKSVDLLDDKLVNNTKSKKKSSAENNKVKKSEPAKARVLVSKNIKTDKKEVENNINEKIEVKESVVDLNEVLKIEFHKDDIKIENEEEVVEALEVEIEEEDVVIALESEYQQNISINKNEEVNQIDGDGQVSSGGSSGAGSQVVVDTVQEVEEPVVDSSEVPTETPVEISAEEEPEVVEENYPKLALINRVYATDNNDWIELYNPTDHDFDLAEVGYRLEKSKTAEDPSLMMRIGNTEDGSYPGGTIIPSKGYYMIVRDDADLKYQAEADAIASRSEFGWFDSGYAIYLGTGAISSSVDVDIVDALGFGDDATYFAGESPAPAITDYYILERVEDSSNNGLDYQLVAGEDLPVEQPPEDEVPVDTPIIGVASTTADSLGIKSDGLKYLQHLDECYGDGKWLVGKWGCAKQNGGADESIIQSLGDGINANNISISFRYRKLKDRPKIIIDLINDNEEMGILLDGGMIQIDNFPNFHGIVRTDLAITESWDQFTLVVDRDNLYWTIYINGEEKSGGEFDKNLSVFDSFKISGEARLFLVDELAIWDRSLSAEEVSFIYNIDLPFYPLTPQRSQLPAELLYSWDFSEGEGSVARDSINNLELPMPENFWIDAGDILGGAMINKYDTDTSIELPEKIDSKDLAISFWWRNSAYPKESRTKVSLRSNEKDRLALVPDYYKPSYWFNDVYGSFTEVSGASVPYDDNWHHLVVSYNSKDYMIRLYVDGEKKRQLPYVWIKDGDEATSLKINQHSNNSEIDNLQIWQGVVDDEKVKEIYES